MPNGFATRTTNKHAPHDRYGLISETDDAANHDSEYGLPLQAVPVLFNLTGFPVLTMP